MQSVSTVQGIWLKLLQRDIAPGAVECARVEPGHFIVVRGAQPAAGDGPAEDYRALESCLGGLEGTRAIYLDSRSGFDLDGNKSLRSWAGEHTAAIAEGTKRAFAIVQMEAFRGRVREELASQGWEIADYGDRLKASSSSFAELINVPREAVRMVLSRGDFATAARFIREETTQRLARDAEFFALFRARFRGSFPAALDHYFIAYPEASCVAAGWDYWQLAERPAAEAQAAFEDGIKEIEALLKTAGEEGAVLPVDACGRINLGN